VTRWTLPTGTERPTSLGFDAVNVSAADSPRIVDGRFFSSSGPFASTAPGGSTRGEAYTETSINPGDHVNIQADFVAYLGPEAANDLWHIILQQHGPITSGTYAGDYPPPCLSLVVRSGKLRWGGGAGPDYNWDNEKYVDLVNFVSGKRYRINIEYIATPSSAPIDQSISITVNGNVVFDGVASSFSFPSGTIYANMNDAYYKMGLYKSGDVLGRQWICYSRLVIDVR
jgi:hypothetical protein